MKGYNAAYIQSIQDTDGSYIISTENDLKELLYVLDERFYMKAWADITRTVYYV